MIFTETTKSDRKFGGSREPALSEVEGDRGPGKHHQHSSRAQSRRHSSRPRRGEPTASAAGADRRAVPASAERAEATLIAANARIGVAKAQWVPQISLTSLGGSASSQLQSMFAGKNAYWYAAGSLSEPIFDAGRIRSNYHLSQAQEQEMLLDYQKTILNALKDVSDSLVGYKETRERREQQAALVVSAADAVRLATLPSPLCHPDRSDLSRQASETALLRRKHQLSRGAHHRYRLV